MIVSLACILYVQGTLTAVYHVIMIWSCIVSVLHGHMMDWFGIRRSTPLSDCLWMCACVYWIYGLIMAS